MSSSTCCECIRGRWSNVFKLGGKSLRPGIPNPAELEQEENKNIFRYTKIQKVPFSCPLFKEVIWVHSRVTSSNTYSWGLIKINKPSSRGSKSRKRKVWATGNTEPHGHRTKHNRVIAIQQPQKANSQIGAEKLSSATRWFMSYCIWSWKMSFEHVIKAQNSIFKSN